MQDLRKSSFGAHRPWIAALIVATPLALLLGRVLLFGETFVDRDLASYYHPAKRLVAALARASGGVPTWNPFFASGQPFAANPEHEVFHPLTTLFFVLPFEVAFRLQVILPLLLALPSMYILLRTLRRSHLGSLSGALAWTFGGYLLSTTNLLPQLFAGSVLPLALALWIRILRARQGRDMAGLALVFGSQCLSGEPSTLVMVPVLCLAATVAERRRASRKTLLCAVLALCLGALVGAATLVPGAHHARKTDRRQGLPEAEAGDWSMPAARALDLLSPFALGHIVPGHESNYWGGMFYGQRKSPYFYSLYPGLLVSMLALAVWRRRWLAFLPWVAVAGLGMLLALGIHAPIWPLARRLPLVAAIRYPEKYILLAVLPLLVMGAQGFDGLLLGSARARRFLARVLVFPAALGLVAALLVGFAAGHLPKDFPVGQTIGDGLRLAGVAAALGLLLWPRWKLRRASVGLLACVLLAVDLGTAGMSIVHTAPVATLTSPPPTLVPLLNRDDDQVLFHAAEWHPTMQGVQGLAKPPIPAQWGLAMTLENDFDRTFLASTDLGTRLFWRAVNADPALQAPLLERRGVTAILRIRPGSAWQGEQVVGPDGRDALEILVSKQAKPILSAVSRVEVAPDARAWLVTALRLREQMRDTACVDDPRLSALNGPPAPAEVHVTHRAPDSLAAEVLGQGPDPSFLAFNQTFDEGWRLTIDGHARPLLKTDISLSGFVVPPGSHHITLDYRDPWVDAGIAISIVGALACLGLVLASGRGRKRASA